MTNPLTVSRNALADALKPIVGTNVYAAPPSQIVTPAAVLMSGDPWAEPVTWTKTQVRWAVTLAAGQIGSNEDAYTQLEQLVWEVVDAVRAAGMAVGTVGGMRSQRYGQAEVAAIELEVRVQVDD